MRRLRLVLPLLLLACSDPQGPCDRRHACEFEGAHVVFERFEPASNVLDPVTRLPLVSPVELRLDVRLRNRGDTASAPLRLEIGGVGPGTAIEVPALQPGETFRPGIYLGADVWLPGADTVRAWADLRDPADPIEPVATARTGAFHLLVPALSVTVVPVRDTTRLGGPFVATVTVRNHSMRVGSPAGKLSFRFVDSDVVFPEWGTVDVPAIPPNSAWTDAVATTIPTDAGYLLDAWDMGASACLRPAATPDGPRICARAPRMVHLVPDLEPCTGATALASHTVATTVLCRDVYYGDLGIWRFDVAAGQRLYFQLSNPGGGGMMYFMQRDGTLLEQAKNGFRSVEFPTAGTWYLVFWSLQNPLLQPLNLSVVDLPNPSR